MASLPPHTNEKRMYLAGEVLLKVMLPEHSFIDTAGASLGGFRTVLPIATNNPNPMPQATPTYAP